MRNAIVIVVLLFVVFLLVKSRLPPWRDPERVAVREKIKQARKNARSKQGAERASAWRDAASLALSIDRPNLAASYARRADRAHPESGESVAILSKSMQKAKRFSALEKLLWKRLSSAEEAAHQEKVTRLREELLSLYEGPLRRPSQAKVLRRAWHLS